IEMEGTYPLPEAQRDRFTARVSMGYPSTEAELDMLDTHGGPAALDDLEAVTDALQVRKLIDVVRAVHVSEEIKQYVVALVSATRSAPELRLGASPRASLHLLRASRAAAGLEGRDYVVPDDVQGLASAVLAHRLLPTAEAQLARRTTESLVDDLVVRLPLPAEKQRRR
ncbi:MAG: MoxR family ATPase, partial [Frankiales bacterium]|nr:MoxR family ATPase [Frankiales bacterium]